jgi:TRAP-type C4-dicarboxylate transport system substrate-binding protein
MINGLRPVNTVDDLKGLKIRVAPSPVMAATIRALGSSPTPVNANEMYVALQTHLVDGVELPLPAIESYKIYEVSKYVAYTNHIWTAYTILMNANAWLRLPRNLRELTEHHFNQAAIHDYADVAKLELSLEGTLRGQGMIFTRPDSASFRAAIRRSGVYAQLQNSYGADAWALLEKSVGRLT